MVDQHCSGLHLPLLHRTIGNGPWEDREHMNNVVYTGPLRQCVRRGEGEGEGEGEGGVGGRRGDREGEGERDS